MAAKELRTSSEDAHSAAAWRVPRLPTDEEIAAMETGGEKKNAFYLAMIRGEIGLTFSLQRIRPSLWPTP